MNDCAISYTSEEASALIEEADLSKSQYHMIHIQAKKRNADIYPAYDNSAKATEFQKILLVVFLPIQTTITLVV